LDRVISPCNVQRKNITMTRLNEEVILKVLGAYDAVVVATPLELTTLIFSGFRVPDMPQRNFQTTVATLVKGKLRPAYFGVQRMPKGVEWHFGKVPLPAASFIWRLEPRYLTGPTYS
jgi:hypothetical protein